MSLTALRPFLPTPARLARTRAHIANLDYLIDLYTPHDPAIARRLLAERRRLIIETTGLTPELILEIADSD